MLEIAEPAAQKLIPKRMSIKMRLFPPPGGKGPLANRNVVLVKFRVIRLFACSRVNQKLISK